MIKLYFYMQKRWFVKKIPQVLQEIMHVLTPVFKHLELTREAMQCIAAKIGGRFQAPLGFLFRRCANPVLLSKDECSDLHCSTFFKKKKNTLFNRLVVV